MARDSIRIAVHDGTYHTDDVFALAITVLWAHTKNYDCTMVRTRDQADINNCQVVLDVGGEYIPERHRYDHHQRGFDAVRPNGIGYASAGLAWKHYGMELCGNDVRVWQIVDDTLIAGIDASDIGVDLGKSIHPSGILPASIGYLVNMSRPTWREEESAPDTAMNQAFWRVYEQAKEIIKRSIIHARDNIEGERRVVEAYNNAHNKQIVIADRDYFLWREKLTEYPEPLFYVYKNKKGFWSAEVVRKYGLKSFESRILFPEIWRGKRDNELQLATGASDAVFCHSTGYLLITQTQESLLKLINSVIEHTVLD